MGKLGFVRYDFQLRCNACGNTDLFIEIMAYEEHLISGNLVYRKLLAAEVDHYLCYECHAVVDLGDGL